MVALALSSGFKDESGLYLLGFIWSRSSWCTKMEHMFFSWILHRLAIVTYSNVLASCFVQSPPISLLFPPTLLCSSCPPSHPWYLLWLLTEKMNLPQASQLWWRDASRPPGCWLKEILEYGLLGETVEGLSVTGSSQAFPSNPFQYHSRFNSIKQSNYWVALLNVRFAKNE